MSFTTTVIYPRKDGATFDLDYYNKTHMPLVEKLWKSFGMKTWHVVEFAPDAPYSIGAFMDWESQEAFGKASSDEATRNEIFGDVKNFSNVDPVFLAGKVVAKQ
ncbi:hypothetical protein BDV96DRAFT_643457 [Lophiotrema nucula]|uniref:EthD domain-containing protein n=1 Tax=Lophiotrema nucula TaxID=690887 RepID=A0A6A5ZHD3_9PLEO|nr:hypothetical protein BDV96DRAFT_643457 [Lophiotrema nucula]